MLHYKKAYTKKFKFDGAKYFLNCKFHKCPKIAYYFSRVISIASDFCGRNSLQKQRTQRNISVLDGCIRLLSVKYFP
jgi:hypothetical protein